MTGMINRAVGNTEAVIGNALGNETLKQKARENLNQAEAKENTGSSAGTAGPFSGTTSGGAAKEHSDRTKGSWDQTIGDGKQRLGNLVGSDSMQRSGAQQHDHGVGQEKVGQAKDAATGVGQQIKGAVGGLAASAVGNDVKSNQLNQEYEDGKARTHGVSN